MLEVGNKKASRLGRNHNYVRPVLEMGSKEDQKKRQKGMAMGGLCKAQAGDGVREVWTGAVERPKPFPEDRRGKLKYQWNHERELFAKLKKLTELKRKINF